MTVVDAPPPAPRPTVNGNGNIPKASGLPVSPRRPRNVIWIVTGIALMLVSSLVALTLAQALGARSDVLVAGRDIARGEVITESDLAVAAVAADSQIEVMLPSERELIVGMVADGDILRGSVLNQGNFSSSETADQVTVIVGFDLPPGSYPRTGLLPGDEVGLIEVYDAAFEVGVNLEPRRLGTGEVVEIASLAQPDRLLISIRVPDRLATALSQIAYEDRLRLVQSEVRPSTAVSPLDPAEPANAVEPGVELSEDDPASEEDGG